MNYHDAKSAAQAKANKHGAAFAIVQAGTKWTVLRHSPSVKPNGRYQVLEPEK